MSGAAATPSVILVGGLGAPYDALLAATLRAHGARARTLGPMDLDAQERGRQVLSRNPCAPLLTTTGALLRAAGSLEPGTDALALGLETCGPCRYALFAPAWRRALRGADRKHVEVLNLEQSAAGLQARLGTAVAAGVLESIAAGDALAEVVRRVRPYLEEPDALDAAVAPTLARVVARIEGGTSPVAALAPERDFHVSLSRRPPRALGRVALVGEPWSLHVDGTAQLDLPRVLARAGVEVEVPPASLWLALRAWEARRPWGVAQAGDDDVARSRELEARVRDNLRRACALLGLGGVDLPDLDALEALSAPWLPSAVRGGYGHVEVALALRARAERRAHAVFSVKSFGCIPSSGIADAIVPVALAADGRAMPFLSLEVSADGEASRESRITLRASGALRAAEAEVEEACARRGLAPWQLPAIDPLAGTAQHGPRPYACSLASAIINARSGGIS